MSVREMMDSAAALGYEFVKLGSRAN